MERLEGGLEKLKSTAAQVDDLKEKLAAQEVELKQKNDDADALIKVVGIEQEKVGYCLLHMNWREPKIIGAQSSDVFYTFGI